MIEARALILKEADNGYTLIVYKRIDTGDEVIQEGVSGFNKTLPNAFNEGRDAIAAMVGGGEKVVEATIEARIK